MPLEVDWELIDRAYVESLLACSGGTIRQQAMCPRVAANYARSWEVAMRCGSCGCVIEKEEDVTWQRGTALCPECFKKGRTFQRAFFGVWLVVLILILAVPVLLCLGGVFLFRFFQ